MQDNSGPRGSVPRGAPSRPRASADRRRRGVEDLPLEVRGIDRVEIDEAELGRPPPRRGRARPGPRARRSRREGPSPREGAAGPSTPTSGRRRWRLYRRSSSCENAADRGSGRERHRVRLRALRDPTRRRSRGRSTRCRRPDTGVASRWSVRISSSLRNTETKFRSFPSAVNRWGLRAGMRLRETPDHVAHVLALKGDLRASARERPQRGRHPHGRFRHRFPSYAAPVRGAGALRPERPRRSTGLSGTRRNSRRPGRVRTPPPRRGRRPRGPWRGPGRRTTATRGPGRTPRVSRDGRDASGRIR